MATRKVSSGRGRLQAVEEVSVEKKKDDELPTRYDFKAFEEDIYKWWEKSDYFKPDESSEEPPYTIPMPPPNVTGRLHLGHALFVALQDVLARFHRMRGRPTLWLPGTDHAGIATQMLVERKLEEEGSSRIELGREPFLEEVWRFKDEHGGAITSQMRRLGASADWTKERFTLEKDMNVAVNEAFVRLHESGLVYRGSRMVNWSPSLMTAVSDLEVETVDRVGTLYYFNYPVEDGSFLPVATTRPETILGDAAVCVNPEDERYRHLVGKFAVVPMVGRRIPIIADEYVDPEFGTGVLKITPGHDPNDYAIGKKYDLPTFTVMNEDATIVDEYEDYAGLERFACREKLWKDLGSKDLALKTEEKPQRVPISQRGGEVIEPLVSTQWFVNTTVMAERAANAVRNGDIRIVPSRFEKEWYHWLDNIQDWCVSRQLWWGHRIPAWYSADGQVFVARSESDAMQMAEKADVDISKHPLVQDDDVLDTWFSSGLWPMATVGWPSEDNEDFKKFYPANCLETGYDILFFWVARMVMLGIEFTGKPPFDTIYMHGLVRAADGQKMSKTKGNVVDPLDVVEEYGADALRYTLVTGVTPGQDVPLSMERVEQNRNFANKIWNVARFVKHKLKTTQTAVVDFVPMTKDNLNDLPLPERWIVSKAHVAATDVAEYLEDYAVGEAGRRIYEFLWDELADWYVEMSKTAADEEQAARVLLYSLEIALRIVHPFMPHVTEYLWQRLGENKRESEQALMTSAWPLLKRNEPLPVDESAVANFDLYRDLVRALRNLRAEYDAEPKSRQSVTVVCAGNDDLAADIQRQAAGLALLARIDVERLKILDESPAGGFGDDCATLIIADGLEAYVPYADLQSGKDVGKEIDRLERQLTKVDKDIATLKGRIDNPGFVKKAPQSVVDETKAALNEKLEQRQALLDTIADLKLSV